MFLRPAASSEAGMQMVSHRSASISRRPLMLSALALAVLALPGVRVRADEAQDTLKKMGDLYRNAKSFDGILTVKQNGKGQDGKPVTLTTVQSVKYKSPNIFHVELKFNGTGAAAKANGQTEIINCDGKTLYQYSPAKKQYMKSPAPPNVPFPQLLQLMRLQVVPGPTTPGAKMLPPATIAGRPALVVEVRPPANSLPAQMPAADKAKIAFVFRIEKGTYHLIQLVMNLGAGVNDVNFGPHTVNGNIATSAFNFAPPAGTKEVQVPRPNGAPGAPGVPGGGPPRK